MIFIVTGDTLTIPRWQTRYVWTSQIWHLNIHINDSNSGLANGMSLEVVVWPITDGKCSVGFKLTFYILEGGLFVLFLLKYFSLLNM